MSRRRIPSPAVFVAESDLISADDAVRIYKVGKSTLFTWLREGRLQRYRRRGDRRTFVSRGELVRFLEFRPVDASDSGV
jgi:hypothetical protein